MLHQKKGKKFHRKRDQRKSLLKSLAANFILRERIYTTEAKAKETKIFVEKMISLAKKKDLSSYRLLISRLQDKKAAKKLFEDISPKYLERKGGYTRIVKTSDFRKRDGVKLVILEFV